MNGNELISPSSSSGPARRFCLDYATVGNVAIWLDERLDPDSGEWGLVLECRREEGGEEECHGPSVVGLSDRTRVIK